MPTNSVGLGWDSILQRLFSTFPSHLPGFGLLLMRLGLGITLIYLGSAILLGEPPHRSVWRNRSSRLRRASL